ncbi:MAG: 3-phosphoserine/phosphohydroxythreonine transaminase [Gammaproteobacteria bacterium]|nr:3-phosphoserine/phosphohydroxythreonine transaminase [Gammaproteobacteria bacterium]
MNATTERVFYFGAGPAAIPAPVKQRVQAEIMDYRGTGISIMELGHRSDAFLEIVASSTARLRALLAVPEDYRILFLPGGARAQFSLIPMNLCTSDASADYLVSGHWSAMAAREGGRYLHANVVASSESDGFNCIPPVADWQLDSKAAYVYLTSNETIKGVELHELPGDVDRPVVCDMTSSLMTRPVDVARYGLIFAATQKNLGTAGLCVVILHRELLDRSRPETPSIFNYSAQSGADSLLNTPPVISWYITDLVLQWLEDEGGLNAMAARHRERSGKLYSVIDSSGLFFNPVSPDCRSRINISFDIYNVDLRDIFLCEAEAAGLLALKGHQSVGGFRASLYNAMPDEGVEVLIDFIKSFEVRYG